MELQMLLFLCGLGVIGVSFWLLLMRLFSTSGTTYEEAIAQQRRATTELLSLAESKNKPKKNIKKANKKLAKKERNKESNALVTGSEPESEAPAESGVEEDAPAAHHAKPHVEFCPPVIVDVLRDAPPNVKASEKKEETIEKKESKVGKQGKGAKVALKQAQECKEETPRDRHNSGDTPAPRDQRKGKKEKKTLVEENVEVAQEEVPAPLMSQSKELMSDKLVRQPTINPSLAGSTHTSLSAPALPLTGSPTRPASKNKKKKTEANVLSLMAGAGGGVNVGELVRVVQEAALSRTEIQILTDALLNKHHDPLPEHSEWTEGPNDPIQKMKKQLADKEKALADEIEASQALHAKLKELRANLNRTSSSARASEQSAGALRAELAALQARAQQLHEDNHALVKEKHALQSKLTAEGEAHTQRVQMEMHIQRLTETEAALLAQLESQNAELSARVMDATAAQDQMLIAQQHAVDMAKQLQDANRAYAEMDQQRAAAAHAEQVAQQELRQARHGINDLQNEVQRLTARAQTAESNVEKLKDEAEKQKLELANENASVKEQLASMQEQLELRESEIAELKQLKAVPAQNGLPAANEAHKAAELAKVEAVVEALRAELATAQRSSREQRDQLATMQEQLNKYQDKNNELRTKNWKVMEALQSAEKALQTRSPRALPAQDSLREALEKAQDAQYKEVASVLREACPTAAPAQGVGGEWVRAFALNLKKELHPPSSPPTPATPSSDVIHSEELTAQNEQLQALVKHYKTIIDDTEGVLSRLQQNVSVEEERWAQQLGDKQRELDELRQRTVVQMQNKIDALQLELKQARPAAQNHSFADAERLTEERLMSGFSDKHKMDVKNGPVQVGLEEI